MNKFFSSLIAVFAGIVFLSSGNALAAAFGVSPPWIENDNLKAGSGFVYVINLSTTDLSNDMIVNTRLEGDSEISQWLTVQNKDNLIMPKGQNIVPMSVSVNIPDDAKTGKYKGNLLVSLEPKTANTVDNVAILLGGNIKIELDVIDYDVTDYWIKEINTDTIFEDEPINLNINLKNIGNTIISSVPTNISVIDTKTGSILVSASVDKLDKSVYPQTMESVELSFPTVDLKEGNYWLDVESLKDGKSEYKNRLNLVVEPSRINNSLITGVEVVEGDLASAADNESETTIQTSVRVRAPITNQLIVVVIGLLLVITGIVVKIYYSLKKKRR